MMVQLPPTNHVSVGLHQIANKRRRGGDGKIRSSMWVTPPRSRTISLHFVTRYFTRWRKLADVSPRRISPLHSTTVLSARNAWPFEASCRAPHSRIIGRAVIAQLLQ